MTARKEPVFQAVPGASALRVVHANVNARRHTGERTGGYLSKNRHNVCKACCLKNVYA
jgi:hypothetical protein